MYGHFTFLFLQRNYCFEDFEICTAKEFLIQPTHTKKENDKDCLNVMCF
jgi:hypothetical protein